MIIVKNGVIDKGISNIMCNISEENKKIAYHCGYKEQSNQLIEECAELIQAVNKYRRAMSRIHSKDVDIALENLIEEIADVEIMLEQIKYLLQIPEEDIQAMKLYKVNRTRERILGNKGE